MIVCAKRDKSAQSITMLIAIVCATLSVSSASQTIYKVTDKNGQITYTDIAPESSEHTVEKYTVQNPNSALPVVSETAAPRIAPAPESAVPQYVTLISIPADGTTIPMGPGNFMVEANISPQLGTSERLQLEIDGTPFGPPQQQAHWQLTNIFRGTHGLRVMRLDESGSTVDTSEISTVFVLRPSVIK